MYFFRLMSKRNKSHKYSRNHDSAQISQAVKHPKPTNIKYDKNATGGKLVMSLLRKYLVNLMKKWAYVAQNDISTNFQDIDPIQPNDRNTVPTDNTDLILKGHIISHMSVQTHDVCNRWVLYHFLEIVSSYNYDSFSIPLYCESQFVLFSKAISIIAPTKCSWKSPPKSCQITPEVPKTVFKPITVQSLQIIFTTHKKTSEKEKSV